MSLHIYNTKTKQKEEFIPLNKGKVNMYVCGPTVYDQCHLGHGRAYVAFDVIYRYLRHKGYEVRYVRNITDIDDKIIARANDLDMGNISLKDKVSAIADKYTKEFHTDMNSLGVLPPDEEPRATGYIKKMIDLITGLIRKDMAYVSGGNVYYRVSSFKEYGALSGRNTDELLSGARVLPDPGKEAPLDFSLWKEAKPDEPWWDSPWGKGRPGWHIECSSMSLSLLGEVFDIHGGGQDLIFPHHENEIAQSCGYSSKQPVRYWIHNGFVTINKEKMSKSLGNFFTIRDILKTYKPEIVRFFLLSQHYRSPVDFSDSLLQESASAMDRIVDCLQRAEAYTGKSRTGKDSDCKNDLMKEFEKVMDDDFNTAKAIGLIFEIVKKVNSAVDEKAGRNEVINGINAIMGISDILGIRYIMPEVISVGKDDETPFEEKDLDAILAKIHSSEDAVNVIRMRNYCRKNKKWMQSDKIRDFLNANGFILRDIPGATECIKKDNIKNG